MRNLARIASIILGIGTWLFIAKDILQGVVFLTQSVPQFRDWAADLIGRFLISLLFFPLKNGLTNCMDEIGKVLPMLQLLFFAFWIVILIGCTMIVKYWDW